MTRMRRLRAEISRHDSARRFRDQLGVDVFLGEGRFTGADGVEVAGRQLTFHRAALCTGARAALPDIPGLSAAEPLTNETLFTLTALPRRLAVLGGGPVGCEMAQAFARFGSRVTLVQHGPQLLAREDSEVAALLATVFAREGIEVRLGSRVTGVRIEGGERVLDLDGAGGPDQLRVDAILVAAGRAPERRGARPGHGRYRVRPPRRPRRRPAAGPPTRAFSRPATSARPSSSPTRPTPRPASCSPTPCSRDGRKPPGWWSPGAPSPTRRSPMWASPRPRPRPRASKQPP